MPNPNAIWLGPVADGNYLPGRAGQTINNVVLHTMVGWLAGADNRFKTPGQQASATYGITLDGTLYQWVEESDTAYANGTLQDPGSNYTSISIEREDGWPGPPAPYPPLPDAQFNAYVAVLRDICGRFGIPIDRQHIFRHNEVTREPGGTECPDGLDVDAIVAAAAATPTPTPPPEEDDMKWFTVLAPDGVTQWVVTQQGFKFPLGDINDLEAIKATGQLVTDSVDQGRKVTQAQLDAWPTLGTYPATGPATPDTVPPHTHPISLTGTTGA